MTVDKLKLNWIRRRFMAWNGFFFIFFLFRMRNGNNMIWILSVCTVQLSYHLNEFIHLLWSGIKYVLRSQAERGDVAIVALRNVQTYRSVGYISHVRREIQSAQLN